MNNKSKTYLHKEVSILPDIKSIWDFYILALNGKITVLPEWLQRNQQTKKWRKAKGKKIKSFLRSFFTGNSLLTPFYIVNIDVLLDYIDDEIDTETNESVKKVFKDMKKELETKKKSGVEYVLLDGQNRLYEAIIPFFQGTLECNKYAKPFVFTDDGEEVIKGDFKFTDIDLGEAIKDTFRNTQIIVAEGEKGHIKAYVDSIVAMNEGEPWSLFESTIIKPTSLTYKINNMIFHDPIIQSLFGTETIKGNVKGMTGSYDVEKKGDARYISELIYLINQKCTSGIGTEVNICDMLSSNEEAYLKSYQKVKKYLELISTTFDCPKNLKVIEAEKPFDKESLRGMVLLLDLISNNLNPDHLNCLLQIKDLDNIEAPKKLLEDYIKWHNKMIDIHTSPDQFYKGEPKPDTYVFNTRGAGPKNMKFRLQFIKDFVNENCEEWKKLGYVNDKHISYQKLKTHLLDKSNYKDEYGRGDNTLDLRSKVNIDHIISKKGKKASGNMDKVNNLVITKPKPNKIKSNRY
jgi:hypothetical protein